MAKVTSAVWQPPTDGPVGRDPEIRRVLSEQQSRRDRLARSCCTQGFVAVVCVLAGLPVSAVLTVLATALTAWVTFKYWRRVGRKLDAVTGLLAAESARRVELELLDRTVARVGDTWLSFEGFWPGVRSSRHWWLAGPDANGLVVAFVDGTAAPMPARVLTGPPKQLGPEVPAKVVDAGVLAERAASGAAWRFATRWAYVIVLTIAIGAELGPQPQVLAWLYGIAGLVIVLLAARQWRRTAPLLTMPSRLAPPLVDYPARILTDRSFVVTLPDESELAGKYVWATNLLGNVRASGRLWVAGTPVAGATLGVGVPDVAAAGIVRFGKGGDNGG